MRKITMSFLVIILCIIVCTGCASVPTGVGAVVGGLEEKLQDDAQVYLDIDFEEIAYGDRYDIELHIDDQMIDILGHGEYYTKLLTLSEGRHNICVYKDGDHSIRGYAVINVSEDMTFRCKIEPAVDDIDIVDSESETGLIAGDYYGQSLYYAKSEMEDKGFEEVGGFSAETDEPITDGTDWIVVSKEIPLEEGSEQTEPVKLMCEKAENVAYGDDTLQVKFSEDNAKRAAVVATTNAVSSDVLDESKEAVDETKLHSYTDFSGDYITVVDEGKWEEQSDYIWHVDQMQFSDEELNVSTVSMDVLFDGEEYITSNIEGTLDYKNADQQDQDMSFVEKSEVLMPVLTVAPELIDGDRTKALQIHEEEIEKERIEAEEAAKRQAEAERKAKEAEQKAVEEKAKKEAEAAAKKKAEEERKAKEAEQKAAEEKAKKEAEAAAKKKAEAEKKAEQKKAQQKTIQKKTAPKKTTPKKTTPKTQTQKKSRTVYCTPKGKCYHYSKTCPNSKNVGSISLDEAKEFLRPCKKCVH